MIRAFRQARLFALNFGGGYVLYCDFNARHGYNPWVPVPKSYEPMPNDVAGIIMRDPIDVKNYTPKALIDGYTKNRLKPIKS